GRRVLADDAASDDDDAAAARSGHAAEEQALAALLLLEAARADLSGHATGDLAHRAKQGKRAIGELDRLVGDGGDALRGELTRQLRLGGEVKVGVEDEVVAEEPELRGLRLLDLDHHIGGPGVRRRRN